MQQINQDTGSPDGKRYHVARKGLRVGPLTFLQMSQRRLTDDMAVWIEGTPDWVRITDVPELQCYVFPTPPENTSFPPPFDNDEDEKDPKPPAPPPPPDKPGGDKSKPTSASAINLIRAMGIAHLVLGFTGILLAPLPAVLWAMEREGLLADVVDYPGFWEIQFFFTVVGCVLSVVLVFAGFGLLNRRPNGRSLSLAYGTTGIVRTLLATIFNVFGIMLPLMGAAKAVGTADAHNTATGFALSCCLGMSNAIYPIIVLIVMNLRSVRESLS